MVARWLRGREGDIVWNALIIVAVLLPLMGLTLDAPRYFILRTNLQAATDAAAEAASRSLDPAAWRNAGDVRLDPYWANRNAAEVWALTTASLRSMGYEAALESIRIDETHDTVTVRSRGSLRLLFGTTPPITVRVSSQSRFRIIRE